MTDNDLVEYNLSYCMECMYYNIYFWNPYYANGISKH